VSFTSYLITHTFTNADGTAGSGSVKATLTAMMTNGPSSIVPASVTANLSNVGALSIALASNIDPGTVPAAPLNAQWRLDLDILGAENQSYLITVPTGGGTGDLGLLLPSNQQVS
jgi:hypothetical protein